MSPKFKKFLKNAFVVVIVIAIFYFLFQIMYINSVKILSASLKINVFYMLISFLLFLLGQFLSLVLWHRTIVFQKQKLKFLSALSIWYYSSFGKYLPGKFWQLAGLIYLSHKNNVRKDVASISAVIVQYVSIIAGLIVSLYGIYIWKKEFLGIVIILFLFLLIPLYPPILEKGINLALKIFKKSQVKLSLSIKHILFLLSGYMFIWFIYGFAVFFIILGLNINISFMSVVFVISSYATSYIGGLLMILIPGGIGVREGLLTLLLKRIVPVYISSFVAIVQRLIFTLAELVGLILTVIIQGGRKWQKKALKKEQK